MLQIAILIIFWLVVLVLSLSVYLKNPRNRGTLWFLLFSITSSVWVSALYFEGVVRGARAVDFFTKLDFGSATLMALFLAVFFIVLLKPIRRLYLLTLAIALPIALVLLAAVFGNQVVMNVVRVGDAVNLDEGILFLPYAAFVGGLVLLAVGTLIYKLIKFRGVYRQRIAYVILGLLLTVLAVLFGFLVLPRVINIPDVYLRLSALSMIFVIGFSTYVLVPGRRLVDVRVLLQRASLYLAVIVLVLLIYSLAVVTSVSLLEEYIQIDPRLVGAVIAVLITLGYQPIYRLFSKVSQKVFYSKTIDTSAVVGRISEQLSKTVYLDNLGKVIVEHVTNEVKTTFVALYALQESKFDLVASSKHVPLSDKFSTSSALFTALRKRTKVFLIDELELDLALRNELTQEEEVIRSEMKRLRLSGLVPVVLDKRIIGFLALGPKSNGRAFLSVDINYLELLSNQAAPALNNALLFQRQLHFNETLKQKVLEATKELRIANAKLKKLDQAKTEFLSIASHQLRSPMSSIKGYVSMLSSGDFGALNPSQRKVMSNVSANAESLIQLVNLFLDITRIEEGRFELEAAKFDIAVLVDEVLFQFRPQAEAKKLKINFNYEKGLQNVFVDQQKIKQVITNLVDNAIKYTPTGEVNISIGKNSGHILPPKGVNFSLEKGEGLDGVLVCVSDTGIGLDQNDIDQLFQKFFRVQGVAQVFTGGSGLGLFVVKKIVELHGGDLAVWSLGKNKGSSFCFTVGFKGKIRRKPVDSRKAKK